VRGKSVTNRTWLGFYGFELSPAEVQHLLGNLFNSRFQDDECRLFPPTLTAHLPQRLPGYPMGGRYDSISTDKCSAWDYHIFASHDVQVSIIVQHRQITCR
jgi:hypothetical protein